MRRKDREITDPGEIRAIVERAKVLHLGLNGEERPYVVPLHYGVEWEEGLPVFYVHGAKEGRKRAEQLYVIIFSRKCNEKGGRRPLAFFVSLLCRISGL